MFTKDTQAFIYNLNPAAIQRMLDFDWLCRRQTPSVAAVVHPGGEGFHKVFFGTTEILIPIYPTLAEATKKHPKVDVLINFASMRSAYESSKEALMNKNIRVVAIIAEGIPENRSRDLIRISKEQKKIMIGPSTVGAIKPGAFRIGNTGGAMESIIESKLYRPGSVGVVAISGGLFGEICNIVARTTDGVNEGLQIGGDKFPGTTFIDQLLRYEKNPDIKMLVCLSELGGTMEYEIIKALKSKKITKPLVIWVSGTVAELFKGEVQFGHAGAKSGNTLTSASTKNAALKNAGAIVPDSFDGFDKEIEKTFNKLVKTGKITTKHLEEIAKIEPQVSPKDFKDAIKEGVVRRETSIISTISDDRGDEPTYNGHTISELVKKNSSVGEIVNQLWFKGRLTKMGVDFVNLSLVLSADHGPAVATAHNAIVTARAGKDLISSVVTGLLTIGDRHGGAIDGAARYFKEGAEKNLNGREFVDMMKSRNILIPGIGHRVKTAQNPDMRVTLIKEFAKKNIKSNRFLNFALEVEKETLKKKNNLILNVDGAIGATFLDILESSGFKDKEINEIIKTGALNGLFLLSRTIGIIGHVIDQKRMDQPLYRHPTDDILYT